ncbi:MAG: F0F1 ATP synthase subunit epsilon [Phycisphaera sp.]|nr:F0F1 ATP synthase subunit epsilon [Phycisphaera sp.]
MNLRIVMPTQVVVDAPVRKINAEAPNGWFCLLPRHVDMTSSLVPGLLSYEDATGAESFAAVLGGTLIKCGADVVVSTPHAVVGEPLGELQRAVEEATRRLTEREREARVALEKIEADFVRRFIEMQTHA